MVKNIEQEIYQIPNSAGRPSDYENITWSKIKFYPEDEAILKTMKDARERIEYKSKLIKAGKYIE